MRSDVIEIAFFVAELFKILKKKLEDWQARSRGRGMGD